MTLSVAMCTYKGAKYIREQLESILNQELKVDEIVVCDDGSKDETLSIVYNIAKEHKDVKWNIQQNEHSLGVCDNFAKAFSLCTGDIILLSDQDDIWYSNKTKVIYDYFKRYSDKDVVFTNGYLIDDSSHLAYDKQTLFDTVGFSPNVQKQFDEGWTVEFFAYDNHATGATMAFRRTLLNDGWNVNSKRKNRFNLPLHDIQLVYKSLETNSLGYINDCLIGYRIHDNQTCGFGGWVETPPFYNDIKEPHNGPRLTEDTTDEIRLRINMYYWRTGFRESLLGNRIFRNINLYRKAYRNLAFYAFLYDLKFVLKKYYS